MPTVLHVPTSGEKDLVAESKGDQGYGGGRSWALSKTYKQCIIVVASCIGDRNGGIPSIKVTNGNLQLLYSLVSKGQYNHYTTYRIYKGTDVSGILKVVDNGYGVAYSIISLE